MTDIAAPTAAPTLADIQEWPAAVPVPQASTAFGFSRSHGFDLVHRGEFPARVIKAGGRYVVVTASIIRSLSEGERGPSAA
jgi:hypothetical protein